MRRAAVLVISSVVLAVVAAPALGAPNGNGLGTLAATCNGTPATITHSAGASFWVGDTHYVLNSISGTFTPLSGPTESFTKTYGQRTGLSAVTITCTATLVFPGEGTFTLNVTGASVR